MISAAHGATYYVSPNGSGTNCSEQSPCSLDQGLITVGSPGDVLVFKDGVYQRTTSPIFTITKGGNSSGYITYRAQNSRKAIISSAPYCRGIRISADWVKLEGIKVAGNKHGAHSGAIKIGAADEWLPDKYRKFHDIIVDDCELYQVGNSGFHITTGEYNVEIKNCYINGTQYHSWWGSAFYTGAKYDANYTVHDISIHDNVMTDISQNGVDVKKFSYNVRIYNNTISKMIECAQDRPGIDCLGQTNEGIFNLDGHDNWAYNNIASECKNGMGVVAIMGDANNRIFNNVFYNMISNTANTALVYRISWGMPAETGIDSYVYNNTFYNCIVSHVANADDTKLKIRNNIGTNYADNVYASAVSSAMFAATASGNFHLTSSAIPMIDTVTSEPFASTDLEGIGIVGVRKDRGAYEYKTTSTATPPPPPPVSPVPPSAPTGVRISAVTP